MILDFRFENFRSFRQEARLCLACNNSGGGAMAHRVSAIYGANASGKTNIVNALAGMKFIVNENAKLNSSDRLYYQPFAFVAEEDVPYLSEVTFNISDKVYRYGYTSNETEILSEWLFMSVSYADFAKDVETAVYVVDGDKVVEGVLKNDVAALMPRKRKNTLALVKLDQENNSLAGAILKWFFDLEIVRAYNDPLYYHYSHMHMFDKRYKTKMMEFVKAADPTIAVAKQTTYISKVGDNFNARKTQIQFARKVIGTKNDFVTLPFDEYESSGTQKMFCISGPFVDILKEGKVVVFDEVDAKFHPLLTRRLIDSFNNSESNKKNAQLIVTTHDVGLIRSGVLQKDQVFFCDKNLNGESTLYSLSNFKKLNNYTDEQIAEKYLEGVFGAIPKLDV